MKELYLYSTIYDFVAENLISQMEEAKNEDIVIRCSSPGGSVFAGWGIIAKIKEHEGKLKIKADGLVASMALYMLIFCDDVEALDVTTFVLHRADMYVGDPDDQEFLNGINKQLQAKLVAKIDAKKLKELKGISIKDIFNPETRIDVRLTAAEAKEIGLINKINKITPAIKAEMRSLTERFNVAAVHTPNPQPNPNPMTVAEFKAAHPAAYSEIFNAGVTAGVTKERDRVEALMVYAEVDPKAVATAVAEGKELSQKMMAEFSLKAVSAQKVNEIKKDAQGNVITEEVKDEEKDKNKTAAIAEFDKAVSSNLKLSTVK